MRQHFVRNFARVAGQDAEHLGGQSRFEEHFGQPQRTERGFLRRLEHHAVVGGYRGRDLVRDLV